MASKLINVKTSSVGIPKSLQLYYQIPANIYWLLLSSPMCKQMLPSMTQTYY